MTRKMKYIAKMGHPIIVIKAIGNSNQDKPETIVAKVNALLIFKLSLKITFDTYPTTPTAQVK